MLPSTMSARTFRTARVVSVVTATIISLACGTNYAYSAYAPNFAEKLKLSSTETNLIGTFGNLGMYTAGIPVGLLVDSRGPRPGALLGAIMLGTGYFSLYSAYNAGPGSVSVPWLCLFSYLTGIGGCAAFAGSVKTSALNFPTHRGTATAFPLSAFGLSAFFFSTISSLAFPDNTSELLLMLAIMTCSMCFLGAFFLRIVPHAPGYSPISKSDERSGSDSSTLLKRTKSNESNYSTGRLSHELGTQHEAPNEVMEETSSLLSKSSGSNPGDIQPTEPKTDHDSRRLDIRGWAMLSKIKFWFLWSLLGILTGIGLMTINNIGNDARAIWHHYDDSAPSEFIQERQLMHVEILSIMSFLGRLLSGVGSDILVRTLHLSRFWVLTVSSLLFLLAQILGYTISVPATLPLLSGLTGLAYGFLFGAYPALVAETFGVHGLSQNWGCMTLAPILSGNVFNLLYGRIFDGNSVILGNGRRECELGNRCYRDAYLVTLGASVVALGVSLWSVRVDWVESVRGRREREREGGRDA